MTVTLYNKLVSILLLTVWSHNTCATELMLRGGGSLQVVDVEGGQRQQSSLSVDNNKNQRRLISLKIVGNDGGNGFPLGNCEGECDSDDDCQNGLTCYQRDGNEPVPGCTDDNQSLSSRDFCYDSNSGGVATGVGPNVLKIAGDNGGEEFPLGNCEGDCDNDSDCLSGLKCFRRNGNEPVPGCTDDQNIFNGKDFCYFPNGNDHGSGSSGSTSTSTQSSTKFRIKMWWQQGYTWQEENFERKWCFQCRNTDCNVNVEIAIRECSDSNTKFEFVGSGQQRQVKVVNDDLCMELMSIDDMKITLQRCDSNNNRQLFTAGIGNFDGEKWELQTVAVPGCLAQPHHPRDGEVIRRQGCNGARFDTTNFFNKY